MDKMRVVDPGVTPGYPGGTPGSKTLILSISGPWDLLETIPRAISDRMVPVPSDFVSSRAVLGQNKVPRALSTSDVFSHVQKPPWHESGVPDFLH